MVEECQRVRLAAAELGCEIVDCRGLNLDARKASDHTAAELAQARRYERAVEEPLRVLVVVRRPTVANVVEVDGELGSVQRSPVPQILSGSDDLVPGFERHGGLRSSATEARRVSV